MKPEEKKLWRVKRHNGSIDGFWVVEYEGYEEEKARAFYDKKTNPRPHETIWAISYEIVVEMSHTPTRQLYNTRNGGKGTKGPCHGCGEKPGWGTREDGRVCKTCREKLEAYNEIQERLTERKSKNTFYRVPSYWPGYYLHHRELHVDRDLGKKMGALVHALVEEVPTNRWHGGTAESVVKRPEQWASSDDGNNVIAELTPEAVEAIRALDVGIYEAIDTAYRNGLDYGQNLLKQLSTGDMTMGQFTEHAVDREQERRNEAAEKERERRKRR